jgi:hypothetical protein
MKRILCWAGALGIAAAPVSLGLALLGLLPDLWAIAALLACPVACVVLYIGVTAGTNAGEETPPLMQVFGGGGRC